MKGRFFALLLTVIFFYTFTVISVAAELPLSEITAGSMPDSVIYKTVGNYNLKLFVFYPEGFKPGNKLSGIVWIHGGGWRGGQPSLFFPHCRYYAKRGAVAFSVQYRLVKEGGPTVSDCISDCKSAMRFIRAHADSLGIDPCKLAVMGDSAGGHLAACLGVSEGHNDLSDNLSVNSVADAMVLYNPVVDLTIERWVKLFETKENKTARQLAREASPLFDIKTNEPPCMVLHGYADTIVPPSQAMDFARLMIENNNRCDLMMLGETKHAFVITGYTGTAETVVRSIRAGDDFLVSIGMLEGQSNLVIDKK